MGKPLGILTLPIRYSARPEPFSGRNTFPEAGFITTSGFSSSDTGRLPSLSGVSGKTGPKRITRSFRSPKTKRGIGCAASAIMSFHAAACEGSVAAPVRLTDSMGASSTCGDRISRLRCTGRGRENARHFS